MLRFVLLFPFVLMTLIYSTESHSIWHNLELSSPRLHVCLLRLLLMKFSFRNLNFSVSAIKFIVLKTILHEKFIFFYFTIWHFLQLHYTVIYTIIKRLSFDDSQFLFQTWIDSFE